MLGRIAIALSLALAAGCGDGELDDGVGPSGGDPVDDMLTQQEIELIDTINAERRAAGVAEVVLRETLICAAQDHSMDVGAVGSCSHTGTDGSDPTVRVDRCGGGGWTGEIIACGQGTPRAAVDAWLTSPGHSMIMLGASKREIGVGMHNNYWTAIFDD